MLKLIYNVDRKNKFIEVSVIDENYTILYEFTIYMWKDFKDTKELESYIKDEIIAYVVAINININNIKNDISELAKEISIYFKENVLHTYKYNCSTNMFVKLS